MPKLTLEQKKTAADRVLKQLTKDFKIKYTKAERDFNIAYLIGLIDDAERKSLHKRSSPVDKRSSPAEKKLKA